MTAVFALLAACGAAGLAYSLLKPGRTGPEQSFRDALREADGPGQDLARRLELLEENARDHRAAMSAIFDMVELLGEKVNGLEAGRGAVPDEEDRGKPAREVLEVIAAAARVRAGRRSGIQGPSAFSERMATVWEASEKNGDPLAIARALNMGVSEVELALKVKKMRPQRG